MGASCDQSSRQCTLIAWLKQAIYVVNNYARHNALLHQRIDALEKILRERTEMNVDVSVDGRCRVILIGNFKGSGYIQDYQVSANDFGQLVDQLRHMQRYASARTIDCPPQFRATFERAIHL